MQKKISEFFSRSKADAVLLRNIAAAPEQNFFYFSGLPFGHYSGSFLALRPGMAPVLIANCLENTGIPGLKARRFSSKARLESILKNEFSGAKKIGINFESYQKNAFSRAKKILRGKKFADISQALGKVRETKTNKEISRIRKAARISEKAAQKIPDFIKKGMTENQLRFRLDCLLREEGDDDLAFSTIVASGRNSSVPHHVPGSSKIGRGILLVDFGAKYKNYCSDITRMFCIGKASESQKGLYKKIFEAKKFAAGMCRPGVKCADVFEETAGFIKKETGLGLIHGLGHGLGLEAHDFPHGFLEKSKDTLKEGMVLTLEPAVYTKQFGIRIEDDILITGNGCRLLSSAPEELVELQL